MPKTKAYWRGYEIYQFCGYRNGWALISYWDAASYFTGTGGCWVSMDEIYFSDEED